VLPILFQDERFVVVNKPSGLIVHRTKISDDTTFALQMLRDQLKQRVWPVHRIDRATSGCLLFALSPTWAKTLQSALHKSTKHYIAWVRGLPKEDRFTVDRPIKVGNKEPQMATTHFRVIQRRTEPRSALLWAQPLTGRHHQIRRHLNYASHPILLDSSHGDTRVNNEWRETHGLLRLALHAHTLTLALPENEIVRVTAPLPESLSAPLSRLGFPTTFTSPRE
jgi:tRNA pseudouridine65 synthase